MKKRVLFVDDEPRILEGLRNRLRRQRSKWEMFFVGSGREALDVLCSQPIDVVVSDIRMPEMDGAALLARVQAEHPDVARIVLSGHAELDSSLRALPVAHQFLTKPCDAGVLEHVIERACGLQALVSDDAVRRIIGRIEKLPPVPRIYTQLTVLLSRENATTEDVSRILKQDMAICAKLLQLVNSAFFRLARSISRVEDAVNYLGFNPVRHIVLAAEVLDLACDRQTLIPLEVLQNHAMQVGSLARSVTGDRRQRDDAFVAGLLHDIGKLVLVVELPEHVEKVLGEMQDQGCPMHAAELSVSGVSHAEIGGYLLGLWGLPFPVVEAVANHHEPQRVGGGESAILAATHIADALIAEATAGAGASGPAAHVAALDLDYVRSVGSGSELPAWRELARRLAGGGMDGASSP